MFFYCAVLSEVVFFIGVAFEQSNRTMKTFYILLLVAVAALAGCRSMNGNTESTNTPVTNTNSVPQNSLGNMNGAPVP
jgi:uncharacterized lipoprotein YajG